MHRGLRILAALLLLGGAIGGLVRVVALEGGEIDAISEWRALDDLEVVDDRRTLGTVTLEEGQQVLFEVCARDLFEGPWQGAVAFELWHLGDGARLMRAELDAARLERVRPEGAVGCLEVAHTSALGVSGTYGLTVDPVADVIPPPLAGLELLSRVRAMRPLAPTDPWYRFAILFGAILLMVSFFVRLGAVPREDAFDAEPDPPRRDWGRAGAGLGALLAAEIALAFVPIAGSVMAFCRGLILASVELGAAILLTPAAAGDRLQAKLDGLGLVRPRGGVVSLLAAPFVGVFLVYLGGWISRLLPAVSQSQIAALVAFPSGILAVVLIGALAPAIEELFFRGLVYGRIERASGSLAAILVTSLAFGVVHAPQVWGDPGSLTSIFVTGLVLTLLRAGTGSVIVPALAHIVHNALTG